jgi:membrane protein implicated in regulation of membrane protease activity
MKEERSNLGLGLLALIPIACCIGVPLVAAAGVSVAVAAWSGGITLAALVLIAAVVLLAVRVRRRHRGERGSSIVRARS